VPWIVDVQNGKNGSASSSEQPVVGFCFSFAVEQGALNHGKLLGWTKGFDVEGVIGKDVVQLLTGEGMWWGSRAAGDN
jgi:hexokinase